MTDPLFERLKAALADQYALTRELGRGGMAIVYLADDIKHKRTVAIKVLQPELAASVGVERFLREIQIAAGLQDPHILPLYDSGERDGFPFFVMPYVEGESLRDRITREKQLPIDDAVDLTIQVANALAYAHSRGVVHRDIKPENIMLTGGSAIVADFGIARAVSAASDQSLTQTGTAIGTPQYMSPEQAAAENEIDGRSDIYSLGCVLYEMLVGTPPFTGPSTQAVMARHAMDAVSPPSIVRDTIPEEVEDAIFTALNKVPADRFPTAAAFAQALGSAPRISVSGATAARRRTTRTTMRGSRAVVRPTGWRPGGPLLWGAAALALLAAGGGIWWARHRAEAGGAVGPDPRRIAVLYFDDRSPDHALRFLADGLTEALIRQLSDVPTLQVISANGVAPFRGSAVGADSVARALSVGTIVEGSVTQSGDRLRVSVSLVNGATGAQMASTSVERPRADLFTLQDTVAQETAIFLRQRLGEAVQLQTGRAGTRNARAWELTQHAQELAKDASALVAAGDVPGASRQLDTGDSLLAQAEQLDASWVAPVVLRAAFALRQSRPPLAADPSVVDQRTRVGLSHAEHALRLAPGNADALEVRGTLNYWRWLNNLTTGRGAQALFDSAEADLRRAVAANPTQAQAWSTLSHLLNNKAVTAESKLAAQRAYEADPYLANVNVILWRLYAASYDLEDKIEAARWCDEGRRRFSADPRFTECRLWLLTFAGQRPDPVRAWTLLEEYVRAGAPADSADRRRNGEMAVAMALARAGLGDSARAVALRARGDATADPTRDLMYTEAAVRTMLGDQDEAVRLLTNFVAVNPQRRASLAHDDSWWFRDLRSDSRFQALIGGSR